MAAISNAIINQYATANILTRIGGCICGGVTIEAALRAIQSVARDFTSASSSLNLGATVLFGLATANLAPASPVISAVSFMAYAAVLGSQENRGRYVLTGIFHEAIKSFSDNVLVPIGDHVITPILHHVILPTIYKVATIIHAVIQRLGFLRQPIWLGVATLLTALFAYRVIVPLFMPGHRLAPAFQYDSLSTLEKFACSLCGAVAFEAVVRAAISISRDIASVESSKNLGRAVLYSLAATNLVPLAPIAIAGEFLLFAATWINPQDPAVYHVAKFAHTILSGIFEHVVTPIFQHVIIPVTETIFKALDAVGIPQNILYG